MRLSTGILIGLSVTSRLAAQSPASVTLGTPDATFPEPFTRIVAIRELSAGRILVSDRREKRLVVADFSSGTTTPVSRLGRGPLEYGAAPLLVPMRGDSTLLADQSNDGWVILRGATPVLTISQSLDVEVAPVPMGVVTQRLLSHRRSPQRLTDSVALVMMLRGAARADTIGWLATQQVRETGVDKTERRTVLSLTISPWSAGEQAMQFEDGWIAVARVNPYRVDWRLPDGTWRMGRPLADGEIPFGIEEKRAFLARVARGSGKDPAPVESRQDWPEMLPAFTSVGPMLGEPSPALLIAPGGLLAIRRAASSARPNARFDVIDRNGSRVADVQLQLDEQLIGFGAASVYTAFTDADGLQTIRRYRWPR